MKIATAIRPIWPACTESRTDDSPSVALTSLTAIDAPPAVPADGESVQVLARVDAVTSQFAPTQLVYPLTLQGVGGRWVIAALDQAPAMSVEDDLVPVVVSPGAAK